MFGGIGLFVLLFTVFLLVFLVSSACLCCLFVFFLSLPVSFYFYCLYYSFFLCCFWQPLLGFLFWRCSFFFLFFATFGIVFFSAFRLYPVFLFIVFFLSAGSFLALSFWPRLFDGFFLAVFYCRRRRREGLPSIGQTP
ncbi:hypothetical protein NEIELOOT_01759 [Neisseria elongata subsp. glycolytica ATCC 29315]|uniref:Uncharacterized protein n=1 Tax=Neisseria elongata subsp. glycolytica ATCC 29315 TaxID=546263 RepID=D4DRR6_NEIEG|nr:hypothetical protein NEIELOOT_01759 [Neisseria elongata subsp. glycolytica ATCC 29315]